MKHYTAVASRTRRITRSGDRWADATVISYAIPSSMQDLTALCMTAASESEPNENRSVNSHTVMNHVHAAIPQRIYDCRASGRYPDWASHHLEGDACDTCICRRSIVSS